MTKQETVTAMDTLNAMITQLKNERHMILERYHGDMTVYVTDEGHDLIGAITCYIRAMDLKKHINFNQVFKRIKKEVLENTND